MKVLLMYFKPSGKYYTEGEYETTQAAMFQIFDEVRDLLRCRRLPGLVEGHPPFIVHVDAVGHPHNHPALIIEASAFEKDKLWWHRHEGTCTD